MLLKPFLLVLKLIVFDYFFALKLFYFVLLCNFNMGTTPMLDWESFRNNDKEKKVNVITDFSKIEDIFWFKTISPSINYELEQFVCCLNADHLKVYE